MAVSTLKMKSSLSSPSIIAAQDGYRQLTLLKERLTSEDSVHSPCLLESELIDVLERDNWNIGQYVYEGPDPANVIREIANDVALDLRPNKLVNFNDLVTDGTKIEEQVEKLGYVRMGVIMLMNVSCHLGKRNTIFIDATNDQIFKIHANKNSNYYNIYLFTGCNWFDISLTPEELCVLIPGEVLKVHHPVFPETKLGNTSIFNPVVLMAHSTFTTLTLYDTKECISAQCIVASEGFELTVEPYTVQDDAPIVTGRPAQTASDLAGSHRAEEAKYYKDYHSSLKSEKPYYKGYKSDYQLLEVLPAKGWNKTPNQNSMHEKIIAPKHIERNVGYVALPISNIAVTSDEETIMSNLGIVSVYACAAPSRSKRYIQVITTYMHPVPIGGLFATTYLYSGSNQYKYIGTTGLHNRDEDGMAMLKALLPLGQFNDLLDAIDDGFSELVEYFADDKGMVERWCCRNVVVSNCDSNGEVLYDQMALWGDIPPIIRFSLTKRTRPTSRGIKCYKWRRHDFTVRSIGYGLVQMSCGFITQSISPTLHRHTCLRGFS